MASKRARPGFDPAEKPVEALVKLSRYYGSDRQVVLAGGGNTSVKVAERLYVKASGCPLAAIGPEDLVAMDRPALGGLVGRDFSSDPIERERQFKEAVLAARLQPEKQQRPSVECVLHAVLPCRFVVHTHPTLVNMLTCCTAGEAVAAELFGAEALLAPGSVPGLMLAKTLARSLRDYQTATGRDCPGVVLMPNHGLVVCGDAPEEILERTDRVLGAIRARLDAAPAENVFGPVTRRSAAEARRLMRVIGPALRGLLADREALKIVRFDDSEAVGALVCGADGAAAAAGGALTPDHIVYCTSLPLWFDPAGDESDPRLVARLREVIEAHAAANRFPPKVVLVRGVGMFAADEGFAAAEAVRLLYLDAVQILAGARRLGGVRYMTDQDRRFIEGWEAEAYRRQVAAGKPTRGRAAGKVAVVTGAAQGFGRQIAEDFAAEGGCAVLADINETGVVEAAGELNHEYGPGSALAVRMDVTEPASIAEAIHRVVRTYGGFDVLVSNAGVLKAESVKTQPIEDFDFVTAVNYKGYFLCVRRAAPILAVQHLARPDYLSDIIQINSKSGLVGSERNFAYAGSKFGGIGLTQSFALELLADGIKVNAICPGNFFDGPLWSDPQTGLFVQYLATGKVPGARTVEDVRRTYEAKVPMGRGCTTADVMKAIYYVIEQRYETGQAICVTGGQVMLP